MNRNQPPRQSRDSSTPRAVLFDFDGVVADTANLHVAAWGRTFSELGWLIKPNDLESSAWLDDVTWLNTVLRKAGCFTPHPTEADDDSARVHANSTLTVPSNSASLDSAVPLPPLDHWVARKRRIARRIVATSQPDRWLSAGVAALIQHLRGRDGLRLGLVTSALREDVELILAPAGLFGLFDQMVTRDDPTPTKPDPAPYLLALERLDVSADQAVALEDSPAGIASAHAAGLKVVAVGAAAFQGDGNQRVAPSCHLTDLRDLPSVLEALGLE
jgi:HAD superfamily hydrolase (TIGR01509 family)